MWKHIASNAITVLIVAAIAVAIAVSWGRTQYSAAGPLEAPICLRVERGANMRSVSEDLAEEGAVASAAIFRIGADYAGKASELKAGSFLVREGASMAEIVDLVTVSGRSTCGTEVVYRIGVTAREIQIRELDPQTNRFVVQAEFAPDGAAPDVYTRVRSAADTRYRIQLAEGATSWQIVESLRAADFLEGDPGPIPAEGALAPDSYEVRAGADRAALVADMQARQLARLEAAWAARSADAPVATPEDALILASIIEKETGVAEERGLVASVFANRLAQGMRLQTDPTVIYGITNGQGVLGRGLRQSELRAATPYNTYVINGLPPTPIANPGLASIEAALNPDRSDYLFFVADGTGGHAFAQTLAEHNENVARWREIEAERAAQ